jgi:FkbM family methyltransferase
MKPHHVSLRARKLLHILRNRQVIGILRGLPAPAIEHRHLKRLDPDIILDIGANRGQFTLLCRQLFPTIPVIAFEPLPSAYAIHARIFDSDPSVTLHRIACGAEEALVEFHVAEKDDNSSTLAPSLQQEVFGGSSTDETITVRQRRVDQIADLHQYHSALLKIDTQGNELDVLKGAASILPRMQWIYVEASFVELYEDQALAHSVIAYLANHGFGLHGIYNPAYDAGGRCVQADLLFQASEHAAA